MARFIVTRHGFLLLFFIAVIIKYATANTETGKSNLCIFHFTEADKKQIIDKGFVFDPTIKDINSEGCDSYEKFCTTEFPEVYLGACPNDNSGTDIVRNEVLNKVCNTSNGISKYMRADDIGANVELFGGRPITNKTNKHNSNVRISRLITESGHDMNDDNSLNSNKKSGTNKKSDINENDDGNENEITYEKNTSSQWNFDAVGTPSALSEIYGLNWKKKKVEVYDSNKSTVIVVIDDGLDITHPEFAGRVIEKYNKNYLTDPVSSDPTPSSLTDNHGTMCGSVATGDYGNNICGTGISPFTFVSGRRLIDGYVVYKTIIDAFSNLDSGLILTNSWGFSVCNKGSTSSINKDGEEVSDETNGSRGKSCSYLADNEALYSVINSVGEKNFITFASGNTGYYQDGDSNLELLGRLTNVYIVGASEQNYTKTSYSSPSASLFISAPVGGDYTEGIPAALPSFSSSTTRCTSSFAGTSAAAPQVAGSAALLIEALKEGGIITKPSDVAPRDLAYALSASSYWPDNSALIKSNIVLNNAGVKHSRDIGFGILKLNEAVDFVRSGKMVEFPSSVKMLTATTNVGKNLIDNGTYYVDFTSIASDDFIVESVVVEVSGYDVYGSGQGLTSSVPDCEIRVKSPYNTVSSLLGPTKSSFNLDYLPGRLMSRQFLGEHGRGIWSVSVTDTAKNGRTSVYIESVVVKLYGHESLISFAMIPSTKEGILQTPTIKLTITDEGQKALSNYESRVRLDGEKYYVNAFDIYLQSPATTETILVQRANITDSELLLDTSKLDAASKKVDYGRIITVPVVTYQNNTAVFSTKTAFLHNQYTYGQSRSSLLFASTNSSGGATIAAVAARPLVYILILSVIFILF